MTAHIDNWFADDARCGPRVLELKTNVARSAKRCSKGPPKTSLPDVRRKTDRCVLSFGAPYLGLEKVDGVSTWKGEAVFRSLDQQGGATGHDLGLDDLPAAANTKFPNAKENRKRPPTVNPRP